MIVADTSAWIEFLRATSSPVDSTLTELLGQGADIATTEVVVMEVLSGAISGTHASELRSQLLALPLLRLRGLADYEQAALIHRSCRSAGVTVNLADCLVAVPAIRAGARLLHCDADFEAIARHTDLEIYPLPPQDTIG